MLMRYLNSGRSPKEPEKKGNQGNLIPNYERSPEELREMGRKGGIASGEARRKKRDLQRAVRLWFKVFEDLEKQEGMRAGDILDKPEMENAKRERSPGEP